MVADLAGRPIAKVNDIIGMDPRGVGTNVIDENVRREYGKVWTGLVSG